MKKLVQVVWSSTSITMIALAIVISGTATTQSVSAQDNTPITESNSESAQRERPTMDGSDTLRTQQRAELEAKRQELRAAQEAAKAQLEAEREANRAARQEKLSASKLEICKAHEANINNRIARIADRSAKHLELFNQISERTQTYYVNSGRTVVNYDVLLADIATKKASAEQAVADIIATTANFSCESENPKIVVEEFKLSLTASIQVLRDYRTTVKDLLVAVKTADITSSDDSGQVEGTE